MRIQKQRVEDTEPDFNLAARRALFGKESKVTLSGTLPGEVPGAGKSAAERPNRHLRVKVTMNLDGDVLSYFKSRAIDEGRSYQVLINDALREFMEGTRPERLARIVGRILVEDTSFLELLRQSFDEKTLTSERIDIVEPSENS